MSDGKRYIYGWRCWFRALRMARAKRHGAGRMKWRYAFKMAAAYRFIVDGQNCRPPRYPRYLRRATLTQPHEQG